ncbi:MAG: caspase family protein [Blastocatellia bacterium]|nr:caspase family protein [Blastocatellia bacterium]
MKSRIGLAVGAVMMAVFLLVSPISGQSRDWQPARTWVFIVGLLEWKHSDVFGSFPQTNRRDAQLAKFFRDQGVPADHLVYLKDQAATIRAVRNRFAQLLAQTRPGDTLFLYFAGHGYKLEGGKPYFATYEADGDEIPGWAVDSIVETIEEKFQGERAMLTADCCVSGTLTSAARRGKHRVSYACLTSSLANEESTGNWTFTEGLLAGLQGKAYADSNRDGRITLDELGANIKADMAFAEGQKATFAVTGSFPASYVLAQAEPVTNNRLGERLEVFTDGDWFKAQIIAADRGRLKVHYYGYEMTDDAWLDSQKSRQTQTIGTFRVGQKVEVKWKGDWYAAKILKIEDNVHYIHYTDYDESWDEWVPAKRIRATAAASERAGSWRVRRQ